jgi:hypothetical protein
LAKKLTHAEENRLVDEALLGAVAAKDAELERDFGRLPDGDRMRVVERDDIAVIVLSEDSLRRYNTVERSRGGKLDPGDIEVHRAITDRAATLYKRGFERVLVRGTIGKPKPAQKRKRPTREQVHQRFLELASYVGVRPDDLAGARPGDRTDLRGSAAEHKHAKWYVATKLRSAFDPPATYAVIGDVMGVTGPRVHQIINEFEEAKEEDDGR